MLKTLLFSSSFPNENIQQCMNVFTHLSRTWNFDLRTAHIKHHTTSGLERAQ